MLEFPQARSPEQPPIKEFLVEREEVPLSAGTMIVRAHKFGRRVSLVNRLVETILSDARTLNPPVDLSVDDIELVPCIDGKHTTKYEVRAEIPRGHIIPDAYTCVIKADASEQTG